MSNAPLQPSQPGRQLAAILILAAATIGVLGLAYYRVSRPTEPAARPDPAQRAREQAQRELQQLQQLYTQTRTDRNTLKPLVQSVRRLVERHPQFAAARTMLAQVLLDTDQPREALAQLTAGLELDANQPEIHCMAGVVAQNLDELDVAAHHFSQAVGLDKRNGRYRVHLASLYLRRHQFDEAERLLLEALLVDSSLHAAHAALSDIYASQNKLSLALDQIRKALECTPTPERSKYVVYVRKQGRLQLRDGRPDDALRALQALSLKEQFEPDVMADMATCRAYQSHFGRAAELYERATTLFPAEARFLAQAAHWRLRAGDLVAFEHHLRALRRLDPNLPIIAELERQKARQESRESESPTSQPLAPSPRSLAPDPPNDVRRAATPDQWHQRHPAAGTLDDVGAFDLALRVVGALDQHVRQNRPDQAQRLVLSEHHQVVDALELGHDLDAVFFTIDRSARALDAPDRGVGVEPDDQQIALNARLAQVTDVAGVQNVEAAVGEGDGLALLAIGGQLGQQLLERAQLAQFLVLLSQQGEQDFIQVNGYHAEAFHFEAGGGIGQLHRGVPVGAVGQRRSEHGQDHVAGAGDVIDRAR